ncbi:ATP-binding cassette domain-containing protein [Nevskia soli]|jgi:ABC-2 type transport system ATP-binding protein|uniref:ATP-binding cassette domain-containing protein n=1 Tax=Nevskia soli TaxID=418856 RepID=UPI0015D7158B
MTAVNPTPAVSQSRANPDASIRAEGLVKTYPNGVQALNGLSFSVASGSVYALLGPNGAGKSTTVKILTTLSRANSGSATVAGIDVMRNPSAVRNVIGCVAQKSGVDANATGRENLRLQGRFYGLGGAALEDRITELLARFRLSEAADKIVRTFSGGMQRKLDIALGLIHQPAVLFLDEPTTGLDPEARAELWEEISRLSGQIGITILLTTHYLEEADRLAQLVGIVDRGRLVAEGTPEGLKSELRGDAVHVEFAQIEDESRVHAALAGVDGIAEIALEGAGVRARAQHGASAAPGVLAALDRAGIKAMSVRIARPSLDDVYLKHTGRSLRDAESETAAQTKGGKR